MSGGQNPTLSAILNSTFPHCTLSRITLRDFVSHSPEWLKMEFQIRCSNGVKLFIITDHGEFVVGGGIR